MFSKGSILVVDDEINLCRILGAKLAKSGFNVVAVHDGQQAVDKVRESSFDVVILDLVLPKLDGLSALAEIRSFDSELPVIVMTACESSEALDRARRHGVSAYVNKPFDLDNLVELVQTTSARAARHEDRRSKDTTILFVKGQPVTIEILNGRTSGVFQSRIEGRDDRTVSVLAPLCNGSVLQVIPRTPVRVGLATSDACYNFNSYILDFKQCETPIIVLDKPGVIYRTQRRMSRRVPIDAVVRYAAIPTEDSKPRELNPGRSSNISTGGIKITATSRLEPGDLVYLETECSGSIGPITAIAEVVRSREEENKDYIVAMKFRKVKGNMGILLAD